VQRLAACVLATLVFVLLGAPPSQATDDSVRYVALGDSYSAASGVLPPDPEAQPQCLRSTNNYPHLIAAETGAALTDVTCGGADTELVTMTIGGNDSGVFINSIVQCGIAGASTLGRGSPCKDRYGSSFEDTIKNTTYPSLVQALRDVRAKAPKATVAILGYPWILPASGGCFDRMPVAEGDVPYLRGIQATLNDAVRRAAAATGVVYVDMNTVSEGHDACQPIGVRWIEPVLQGTNPVVVHPNSLGESQMAAQTMAVLGLD